MRKFSEIINSISYKHNLNQLFNDYLELTICALSNQKKEDRYIEIATRYQKEEILGFSEALAAMIVEMGDLNSEFFDPLGDFFEQSITNGRNGQFFTPLTITKFMAEITIDGKSTGKRIADPACGSGRTLMSAAQLLGPGNQYYAADVDKSCAMMAAINMCLHGMSGEIAWMDSLSNRYYGGWFVATFPFPHLIEMREELSEIVLRLPEAKKNMEVQLDPPRVEFKQGNQLLLFE